MTVRELHAETGDLLHQVFLDQDVGWPAHGRLSEEDFFRDVVSQGMAPLLFRKLAKGAGGTWSQSLVRRLRELALRQAAFDLVVEVDLRQLLDAFAQIDIRPLLLKGTPLSYTLYPEPGLRPRCDTDLLIPESGRDKAAALMKKTGYTPLHEARIDYIKTQMSYARKTAQGITCRYDIHWQVSDCNRQFSRDFVSGRLFEQADPVPSLGENARTLSKVDALIFACIHRAGHFSYSGDRLIWLYDIHLLCQALTSQEAIRLHQRAKELRIASLCVDALLTAQSWFGTVFSEELQTFLQDEIEYENSSLLLGNSRNDGIKTRALLELRSLPTWKKRVLYLLQNLFPPAEFMLWRYHTEKKFLLPWLYLRRYLEGVMILFWN